MAEITNSRFPHLGKLSLAILEAKVEDIIGEKATDLIRSPYDEKVVREKLAEALGNAEQRFILSFEDKDLGEAVRQLPLSDLPSVILAVQKYYAHPEDRVLAQILLEQLSIAAPGYTYAVREKAVKTYLDLLRQELILLGTADDLRNKLVALAALDMRDNLARIAQILEELKKEPDPTNNMPADKVVPQPLQPPEGLQFPRASATETSDTQSEFDAFVYAVPADIEWVNQTVLPCLKREQIVYYVPSTFQSNTDLDAQDKAILPQCKRVLLVVSQQFLAEKWRDHGETFLQQLPFEYPIFRCVPLIRDANLDLGRLDHLDRIDFSQPEQLDQERFKLPLLLSASKPKTETMPPIQAVSIHTAEVTLQTVQKVISILTNLLSASTNYQLAVDFAQTYRAIVVNFENPLLTCKFEVEFARALMYVGQTNQAIETLTETISTLDRIRPESKGLKREDWRMIAGRAHNHLGYVYWMDLGYFQAAIQEFEKALQIYLSSPVIGDPIATTYDNLGRVSALLGFKSQGELLIKRGMEIREALRRAAGEEDTQWDTHYRYALSLDSLANALLTSGEINRAFLLAERSYRVFRQVYVASHRQKGQRGLGLSKLTLGRCLRYLGSFHYNHIGDHLSQHDLAHCLKILDQAEGAFLEALDHFAFVQEEIRIYLTLNELGCVYREKAKLLDHQSSDQKEIHDPNEARKQAETYYFQSLVQLLDLHPHPVTHTIQSGNAHDGDDQLKNQVQRIFADDQTIANRFHALERSKHLVHLIDTCDDLARNYYHPRCSLDLMEEATLWLEHGLNLLPPDYQVSGGLEILSPVNESFRLQAAKLYQLKGTVDLAAANLTSALDQFTLSFLNLNLYQKPTHTEGDRQDPLPVRAIDHGLSIERILFEQIFDALRQQREEIRVEAINAVLQRHKLQAVDLPQLSALYNLLRLTHMPEPG